FALALLAANQMKEGTQDAVARMLFKNRYDLSSTLSQFSKALVTILDLKTLTEEIVRTLVKAMDIKAASLYLLDKEQDKYVAVSSHGWRLGHTEIPFLTLGDTLPRYHARHQSVLVRGELERSAELKDERSVLDTLKAMEAEVCIPFVNKDRVIGFCNLGARADDHAFSADDLHLLTTLGQNASIALDNAMLYQDLKRSQILMRRTDRLRSLETIAGGFAHEVRNPLTSIKTFVQLAPERKDDPEFMGPFTHVVLEDVHRIERLIKEILDYARYMTPQIMEDDLNEIVSSCLHFVEVKADNKLITIHTDLDAALPPVQLDRQQIKQVLMNLLLNAMDAMNDRGGRLTVSTRLLTKQDIDPCVQIEIGDTGCGIDAHNLEHIFDPFYTTKHDSDEREGTGLGLTIAHQIVQEHHGYIEVKSEPGAGTTFFVNLPLISNDVDVHSPETQDDRPNESRGK
ncbi:MAG: ATP-binding protein, partial [Nitrospiraceae bacterium]